MKRSKKLWIALAALVAVVAICAFALSRRPTQYRFLSASQLLKTEVLIGPAGPDFSVRTYRSHGTLESVADSVSKELLAKDGWRPYRIQGIVQFARPGQSVTVQSAAGASAKSVALMNGADTVLVYVAGPPSAIDDILARLHLR